MFNPDYVAEMTYRERYIPAPKYDDDDYICYVDEEEDDG